MSPAAVHPEGLSACVVTGSTTSNGSNGPSPIPTRECCLRNAREPTGTHVPPTSATQLTGPPAGRGSACAFRYPAPASSIEITSGRGKPPCHDDVVHRMVERHHDTAAVSRCLGPPALNDGTRRASQTPGPMSCRAPARSHARGRCSAMSPTIRCPDAGPARLVAVTIPLPSRVWKT